MSTTLFGLREFGDPVAFLTGARIPLITTDGRRAECAGDLVFVWNPTTASYGSCAVARMGRESWLLMDLADPDVARWCDRRIAHHTGTSTGHPELTIYRGDSGDPWRGWTCGMRLGWTSANNACSWPAGTWTGTKWSAERQQYVKPPFDCPALATIPCDEAHIPDARAAILRALFGVSNA